MGTRGVGSVNTARRQDKINPAQVRMAVGILSHTRSKFFLTQNAHVSQHIKDECMNSHIE